MNKDYKNMSIDELKASDYGREINLPACFAAIIFCIMIVCIACLGVKFLLVPIIEWLY